MSGELPLPSGRTHLAHRAELPPAHGASSVGEDSPALYLLFHLTHTAAPYNPAVPFFANAR